MASYTYTSQNNYLDTLAYGNGDSVKYTYDKQGRVTTQTYEDGDKLTYHYNNDGELARITDSAGDIYTAYYYDLLNRPVKVSSKNQGYRYSVEYGYDTQNNLSKLTEAFVGYTRETNYGYDDDNRITSMSVYGDTTNYTYDAIGRLNKRSTVRSGTTRVSETYQYHSPSTSAAGTTTGLIYKQIIDTASYDRTFTYNYDSNGNIGSVSDGTNTTSYAYDSANQLIRENNQAAGKTWTWTYDNAGNILTRKEYAYTTGTVGTATDTVNYTYGDSSWGDLLTAYDGNTITYEKVQTNNTIGNPLSDGTWNYTWEHGRQLSSMTNGTDTWNFLYDADGLRTYRNNGTTDYLYTYTGDRLTQLITGSTILRFTYSADGRPLTFVVDGANYYYVTNIQGDVLAILDNSGNELVSYTYDAWGKVLSITGSKADTLGVLNPLRYRSYIYDQDTGLYYLQSRYYNPETGRFLNADEFVATGQGLLGNNMFTYCLNNPVMYRDQTGTLVTETVVFSLIITIAEFVMVAIAAALIAELIVEVVEEIIDYSYEPFSTPDIQEATISEAEHTKNKSEKNRNKHEEGNARRKRDQGGEKKKQKKNWVPRNRARLRKDDVRSY